MTWFNSKYVFVNSSNSTNTSDGGSYNSSFDGSSDSANYSDYGTASYVDI